MRHRRLIRYGQAPMVLSECRRRACSLFVSRTRQKRCSICFCCRLGADFRWCSPETRDTVIRRECIRSRGGKACTVYRACGCSEAVGEISSPRSTGRSGQQALGALAKGVRYSCSMEPRDWLRRQHGQVKACRLPGLVVASLRCRVMERVAAEAARTIAGDGMLACLDCGGYAWFDVRAPR